MRICIYNKYFATLGGGERHIGVIAEMLSRNHQVIILHCGPFKMADLQKKLNLNLEHIKFVDTGINNQSEEKIKRVIQTQDGDLFINATHYSDLYIDNIPNVILIYFPRYIYPKQPSTLNAIVMLMGSKLFREYRNTLLFNDFYGPEILSEGYGRWSKPKCSIDSRKPFSKMEVEFFEPPKHKPAFSKHAANQHHQNLPVKKRLTIDLTGLNLPSGPVGMECETAIPANIDSNSTDRRKLGIFVTSVWIDSFSLLTKFLLSLWKMPKLNHTISRLFIKSQCLEEQANYKKYLCKNALVITNSNYTSGWIKRIYGAKINPKVLYPPTNPVNSLDNQNKLNQIISVGRFFTGGHSKKQLELIKYFKEFYDHYSEGKNYTFHLCGGTHKEPEHQKYLNDCYRSSEGYPIVIHPNIEHAELLNLYQRAKIFWHGAGLFENPNLSPERFEHFGITTVEAMSFGCVPVVFGMAGPLEIVQQNKSGFVWHTSAELLARTNELVLNDQLLARLAAGAEIRAKDFGYQEFENRFREMFAGIGVRI